jgi:hypothetical protein
MDTHHHMVSVRVKSVLDSCDDEEGVAGDDAMMEVQASQQVCFLQLFRTSGLGACV